METLRTAQQIQRRTYPRQRRIGHPANPGSKRSGRPATPDFLTRDFEPIICAPQVMDRQRENQRHFTKSLSYIKRLLKIPGYQMPNLPYPLNVHAAFADIQKLNKSNEHIFLIKNDPFPYCIATATPMYTGHHLYYISLLDILRICRDKKRKAQAGLVLSICAYLYQQACVPSYTKGDYMDGCYDMIREWVINQPEEWDQETVEVAAAEFRAVDYTSTKMHKTLSHPYHLSQWKNRMDNYRSKYPIGNELFELSQRLYNLFQKFPDRHLFQQFWDRLCPRQDDEDSIMAADEYISFVWSNDGWLSDQVFNYINDSASSYSFVDEPLEFQVFDTPGGRPAENLEYEKAILSGIEDLVFLLNNL